LTEDFAGNQSSVVSDAGWRRVWGRPKPKLAIHSDYSESRGFAGWNFDGWRDARAAVQVDKHRIAARLAVLRRFSKPKSISWGYWEDRRVVTVLRALDARRYAV